MSVKVSTGNFKCLQQKHLLKHGEPLKFVVL
jgi:hypothetical protein